MYTVLAEGDDMTDPVTDAARAALDGHVVLSRKLANSGHFPAVDILASVSRVMSDVVTPDHRRLAMEAREVLSTYRESADLIEVGAYVAGSNPRVDRALKSVHARERAVSSGSRPAFHAGEHAPGAAARAGRLGGGGAWLKDARARSRCGW